MPRAFDRQVLPITNNPNDSIEFWIRRGLSESGELWRVILESIKEQFDDLIREVLQRLLRFALDPEQAIEDLLGDLTSWADNLGAQITSFIYSVSGLDFSSWENFVASLSDGHGIDLPGIGDAMEGIDLSPGGVLSAIFDAAGNFLRNLLPSWIPQVSVHSIGDSQPNLLLEGSFQSADTLDGGGFTWDGTDGKTAVGCAVAVSDGEDHVLVSNLIPVSVDQVLSCGGFVSHAGVSGTDVIRVELNTYLGDVPVSTELIEALTPSGDSTDWTTELSGTFEVPDGVDMVALQIHVTSDAVAGVTKFDDCWIKKEQLIKQSFVSDLVAALADFTENIRQIIDNVFNAFNNLGEWLDEHNPVSAVMDAILGLLGIGRGNQADMALMASRVLALESAANTITMDFNGASSSSLGGDFSVSSSGGGAGSMGLNGSGAAVWHASGTGNRTQIARYTGSALTVNRCHMQWYLASTPQSYLFDDAYTYVCCRMDGTTNYLRVRSGWDSVRIQAVVSGSASNVGSAWSGSPKNGDKFDWFVGDGSDERHHVLLRNGQEILNFSETTSVYGGSNLHVGVGMETGNRAVFWQNIPAGLSVVTAAEVL